MLIGVYTVVIGYQIGYGIQNGNGRVIGIELLNMDGKELEKTDIGELRDITG